MSTSWITESELTSYLNSLGITSVPSGIDLADEIQAAVDEWQLVTGYYPFKAESADSTVLLSPKGLDSVDLLTGYISITSVSVGVPHGGSGTAVTVGTDFFTWPPSATDRNQPINYLLFTSPQTGDPNSIQVVGKRGYGSSIPSDVWRAVRDRAAASVIQTALGYGGAVKREKKGSVELEFVTTDSGLSGFASSADSSFTKTAMRYKRIRL